MTRKVKIACLPVAGIGNPFQYLMIQGLNTNETLHAYSGNKNRLIGIFLTAISSFPDYIHFDWIDSLYARRNKVLMLINAIAFLFQIYVCKYIFRIKIVATLHNIKPHDAKNLHLHFFIYKQFLKCCIKIRVFSNTTIAAASKYYDINTNKFFVIPEGSFVNYYPNNKSKAESRKTLELPDDAFIFLFLGNIRPYKGIQALLDIYKASEIKDSILIIAGNSPDKAYLEKIQKQTNTSIIIKPGFITTENVQLFYNAANIVVLPFTEVENSGSAILAMGFEKAVIAPKKGVLSERLSEQPELLYNDGELGLTLKHAAVLSELELKKIGQRNADILRKYQWEDFCAFFL